MDDILLAVIIFFVTINLVAFLMMWLDKSKATKKGSNRISEGMLFFMATFFGSVGVYLGMFAFRHKTRKWFFIVGIPFIILQNIIFLLFIYQLYLGNIIL